MREEGLGLRLHFGFDKGAGDGDVEEVMAFDASFETIFEEANKLNINHNRFCESSSSDLLPYNYIIQPPFQF